MSWTTIRQTRVNGFLINTVFSAPKSVIKVVLLIYFSQKKIIFRNINLIFFGSSFLLFTRYQNVLSVCLFLCKNIAYFGYSNQKLNNPTDHNVHDQRFMRDKSFNCDTVRGSLLPFDRIIKDHIERLYTPLLQMLYKQYKYKSSSHEAVL